MLCGTSGGCASSLRLSLLAAAAEPPSNVALFFSVDAPGARIRTGRRVAQPVGNLKASDFRIYEDDELVSGHQTLANPELAMQRYTLLLFDMSSNVVMTDQLSAIRGAAQAWLTQLRTYQHVAVYAFDGAKSLYEIMPFSASETAVDKLPDFQVHDPATNLNGAVLLALSELEKTVQGKPGATMPLRLGSLVVLTDGLDRANRVSQRQMLDAVEATPYHVYALGIGRDLDDSVLSRIGKSGYVRIEDTSGARGAFRELADLIQTASQRYYLLRYCSPSRAGKHRVRVEVDVKAGSGQLQHRLDATGFSAGCDVMQPPTLTRSGP